MSLVAPVPIHHSDASHAMHQALAWHARYGRNPSSLVALDPCVQLFEQPGVEGALPYHAVGRVWLAGEPLAPAGQLELLMAHFVAEARRRHQVPVFAPVGPLVSRFAPLLRLQRVQLGATPYLYLPDWQPRGLRFARLRGELNRARRAGVQLEEVDSCGRLAADLTTQLGRRWLATRRVGTALGWIFRLDPQHHAACKRLFVARGPDQRPAAFVSCSPLPTRSGWYLEDVVRAPDSPAGSTAALVAHALHCFQAEGAAWATLGGVPLAEGTSAGPDQALRLGWLRRPLSRWYHFEGVARFKAQFEADAWEGEELLVPAMALPLAAWAVTRLALPGGLGSLR